MVTYYSGQYEQIANVFHSAITVTAATLYSEDQCTAWAGRHVNLDHWRIRCDFKRPFVSILDGRVVGFIELDSDGHIDCHYVHPDYNRQGIGSQLLLHVIKLCDARQIDRTYVEASHIAKGLYLKHGFQVVRPNIVRINDIEIPNWVMQRARPDLQSNE